AVAVAIGLAAARPATALPSLVRTDGSTAEEPPLDRGARVALRLRLLLGTAGGLAVVIGLAAVVAPLVARQVETTPVDPRRYVQPPVVDSLDENPLIRISGWALDPDRHLLDVRTERLGTDAPDGGDVAGEDPGATGADP